MRVLITGAGGFLGSEFRTLSDNYSGHEFLFRNRKELDIADYDVIAGELDRIDADVIINCAAFADVDRAEAECEAAMRTNRDGVAVLASAAESRDMAMIHISTDYVFDGSKANPYSESDAVDPVNFYGRTKAEGELAMLASGCRGAIIRASWIWSHTGRNFFSALPRLLAENREIRVVYDQTGSTTYAPGLVDAIMRLLPAICRMRGEIFHYSDLGAISRYDFARRYVELTGCRCKVIPVPAKSFRAQAPRPQYSVLSKNKIMTTFGLQIPHWDENLLLKHSLL